MALALFPGFRHAYGLDGLSYLAVAADYAEGRWGEAVNPYWSPLYSWLHVPLLALGVDPLAANTVVAAAIAGATVLALGRLLRRCCSDTTAAAMSLATAPLVIRAAHPGVFADLLLAAVLLALLAELLDDRMRVVRAVAVRAGLLMALAYLAKLYALPFVAVLVPLVLGAHLVAAPGSRSTTLRRFGLAAGVAVLAALPWVIAVGVKEGRPTAGTAGSHNLVLVSPGSLGSPIGYRGLLEPSDPGAFSAWRDPSSAHVDADGWHHDGRSSWERLTRNLQRNTVAWGRVVAGEAHVLAVAAVAGLVAGGRPRRTVPAVGLTTAAVAFSAGYLLTVVEPRYLWFVLLVLTAPAARLVERVRAGPGGAGAAAVVVLVVTVGLSATSVTHLSDRWGDGAAVVEVVDAVGDDGVIGPGDRVATGDSWLHSALLCFRLGCTFLGRLSAPDGPGRTAELHDHDVHYYVTWRHDTDAPSGTRLAARGGELRGLRIHEVARPTG